MDDWPKQEHQYKYTINGNDPKRITDTFEGLNPGGNYNVWSIEQDGVVVAKVYGGMSLMVALAACERLNSIRQKEFCDGWFGRAEKLMKGE